MKTTEEEFPIMNGCREYPIEEQIGTLKLKKEYVKKMKEVLLDFSLSYTEEFGKCKLIHISLIPRIARSGFGSN